MTAETPKTAFKLTNFKVPSFTFTEPNFKSKGFKVDFKPKGLYDKKTGEFDLILDFKAIDEDHEFEIMVIKSVASFKFNKAYAFNEIPEFFYPNALAIVYPFIRAFASTLTLQANTEIMMLGLYNFSNLKDVLMQESSEK